MCNATTCYSYLQDCSYLCLRQSCHPGEWGNIYTRKPPESTETVGVMHQSLLPIKSEWQVRERLEGKKRCCRWLWKEDGRYQVKWKETFTMTSYDLSSTLSSSHKNVDRNRKLQSWKMKKGDRFKVNCLHNIHLLLIPYFVFIILPFLEAHFQFWAISFSPITRR